MSTTKQKQKAALSFTGGKDCLLALTEVHTHGEIEVVLLVTFGPPEAFLEEEEEEDGESVCVSECVFVCACVGGCFGEEWKGSLSCLQKGG